jgi:hypothetical protein
VRLCCPLCGTWTVPFAALPGDSERVGGECSQCGSAVSVAPSETGVTIAAARVAALKSAVAKVRAAAG